MPKHSMIGYAVLAAFAAAVATTASAADEKKMPAEPVKKVTFDDDVLPIFRAKCGTCHNGSDRRGGLALDDYALMMEGGASGDVVFGGDLESSYLWLLVTHDSEPVMPPNSGKLPDNELEVIRKWIEQGILRDSGSKAKKSAPNPALAKVTVSLERPDGPPPMPAKYLGDPSFVPPRPNSVTGLAVNPWSSLAAVAGHEQVTLVDLGAMASVGTLPFPEGTPTQVGFSQNGKLVYVGGGRQGQSGLVALYDLVSGERIASIGNEYDSATAADLSPDLSLVVIGTPKKLAKTYSSSTGEVLYEISKHTDWVTAAKFSPDGVLLATGDRSGGLAIWEAETGREFLILAGQSGAINAVDWRADSNILASAGDDDQVHLWELNDGKEVKKFNGGVGDIADLEFTRDGKLLVTGRSDIAKLFDAAGKMLAEYRGLKDDGMKVAYDHEGKRVLAGDWSGSVVVWSAEDKKQIAELRTNFNGTRAQLSQVGQSVQQQSEQRTKLAADLAKLKADLSQRKKAAADAKASLAEATKAKAAVDADVKTRDAAVTESRKQQDQASKSFEQAKSTLANAQKAVGELGAAVAQTTKTRDEAKKSVGLGGDSEEVKKAAAEALKATEAALAKAQEALAAKKQLASSAEAEHKKAEAAAKAATENVAKRVAERKQLDEKLAAATKQLAAWQQTSKQASAKEAPSAAESKRLEELSKQVADLDAKLKPLIERKQVLERILAMGGNG